MNNIATNIKKAIAAHGLWKTRLKSAIQTRSSEFEVEFVESPHNCEFGKWLDGDKAALQKYPEYSEVFQMHKELHVETARIMKLALEGKEGEATSAISVGSRFASLSAKLTLAMMNWKKRFE